jgi:hypothetical protein
MARLSKLRKTLVGTCWVPLLGVLVVACVAWPAASLGFGLPIETPTVPVKTPTVPVKTPTVPVKTPTVPVKIPTVPVKTPTVPVKIPTVPVKAPTVPVKTPTVPVKTPTVPVKTPTAPVKAPAVTKTPTVPARAPAAPVEVPSSRSLDKATSPLGGAGGSRPAGGESSAGSGSTSSPQAGVTSSGSASDPSSAGGRSGYGTGPGTQSLAGETTTGRESAGRSGARARTAEDRTLAATVARLQGCLSELPERPRQALMLRSGIGAPQPLGPRATAARLHLGVMRLARVERRALAELRGAARAHACGRMGEIVAAVVEFLRPSENQGGVDATGGVEAVRYTFSPPSRHAAKPSKFSTTSLLGGISPMAGDAIVVLLLLVVAAIAAGIVVTHGSGHSPPWRRWRRRVADSLRRPR